VYYDPNGQNAVAIWGTRTLGAAVCLVPVPGARVLGVGLIASTVLASSSEETGTENITQSSIKQRRANIAAGPPPGNCSNSELSRLQGDVNRLCKGNGRQSCSASDSCPTLNVKLVLNAQCALAREKVNNRCFAGGDLGHKAQAQAAWNSVQNCTVAIARSCL